MDFFFFTWTKNSDVNHGRLARAQGFFFLKITYEQREGGKSSQTYFSCNSVRSSMDGRKNRNLKKN
jgi:hypothetical protein